MRRVADLVLRSGIILAFAVLLACVSWQVISRYVLGTPSTVTDELARFIFMWLALVGGAFTYGQGRHLAIDFLPMSVKGRKRQATEAAITLLIAAFALIVMVWGGSQLVLKTLASGQISPSLRVPMGWVYGAVPVAGAIITAYAGGNLLRIAQGEEILKPADELSVEMADTEESKR
ncbi:TRAP transporter small permease [Paracoccus sp. 1_MG-2023]|uniref:TRAP transporter small permease n=1 Tax=unclassified Paracoccus (in: a-proteobacteria) TaxID=2688777 RepID=UPI001C084652|nr:MULTISPECIES: TRAP transporter small permease [unclassified Paracoccus (in: a-proteobacteria)]MBU2956042.1 TRAP transporter small permease [Paracoccus sp. C2R09]MDO6669448.1 TRAP transporter small permease [Paracoccus sp. 1_MG-2023]